MAGRPLLSQYKAFSATRSPFPRGQVCFQHRINNIREKEEELSAFTYGGGNGISGVVEELSQGRLDGSMSGYGTKAHGTSSIKLKQIII